MKARSADIIIALILLLAAGLRFYNLTSIPFTHDEFSAMFRTGFSSFTQLMTEGVLPDFHPAGVQVFLNYYTSIFGETEWVVKFPFILSGLGSIFLIYRIGAEWFNRCTGLLTAAFMATVQYFIFYSQIARPYSLGLFFGLLAMLYWKRLVFAEGKLKITDWLKWIIFAGLCSYIHYYLLLSLVLLSIIGVFYIRRAHFPLYILSGVCISILFLPHLPIFLEQISRGGIESWLAPPEIDFLLDYFRYVFEYSTIFLVGTLILILAGIASSRRIPVIFWIGPLLFMACFAVGYCYSIEVNAILQFSGLIFCLPLLFLSLFYLLSTRKWLFITTLLFIPIAGVYGLIEKREHYEVIYQSPYEYVVRDASEAMKAARGGIITIIGGRTDIIRYYLKKYGVDESRIFLLDDIEDPTLLIDSVKTTGATDAYLGIFAEHPPFYPAFIRKLFPAVVDRNSYFQAESFHFRKIDGQENWYLQEKLINIPEDIESENYKYLKVTRSDTAFVFSPEVEFGLGETFSDWLSKYQDANIVIDLTAEFSSRILPQQAQLVISIEEGDSILHWSSTAIGDFYSVNDSTYNAFHSVSINYNEHPNALIKTYIWNMGREEFSVHGLHIGLRTGNPELYGLYTPILDHESLLNRSDQ